MSKPVKIVKDETPVEVIGAAIVEISKVAKQLRTGPLNKRALSVLIQNAMPVKKRLSQKQIEAVLDAAEFLETEYLTK